MADEAGNLYGTSSYGGIGYNGLNSQTGYGTVFKVLANGDIITLHSFTGGSDGSNPGYGLTWGMDGNLYGVTAFGGASNNGTIFRISRDGNLTNLHTFNGYNGSRPIHPLCVAQDGHLYGTTYLGGNGYQTPPPFATGAGTVFRISTNGDFSMILQFGGTNGFAPHSKLMAMEDGNLYGTSSEGGATYNAPFSIGDGSIFCLRTNGTLSMVHSFSSSINQGARSPMGGVVQGNDGRLYGTTFVGGVHGYGTVFRISVPMSPILQSPVLTNNNLLLTWSSVAEQTYQLQYTTNLLLPAWFDLGSVTIATNGTMSASDAISGPQRFYRVVVLP